MIDLNETAKTLNGLSWSVLETQQGPRLAFRGEVAGHRRLILADSAGQLVHFIERTLGAEKAA